MAMDPNKGRKAYVGILLMVPGAAKAIASVLLIRTPLR